MTEPDGVTTRWQRATVREVRRVSATLVSLRLEVADRIRHRAGQHYVLRLTAEDGYTASRSYSIASAPGDELVELCIERLADGEVSGYLYDVVEAGDELEVRGPIGGWFVWDGVTPAVAVGGGSGVVPLVSMLRHARDLGRADLIRLAVSGRSASELPYLDELISAGATIALTSPGAVFVQQVALGPERFAASRIVGHRLTGDELAPLLASAEVAFVCGSTGFAEAMTGSLTALGMPDRLVRVERFGPSGDGSRIE